MKTTSLALFLFISFFSISQLDGRPLVLNELLSTELSSKEPHSYKVESDGDKFIQICVDQKGIDVKIVAKSPSGERVGSFDSPNGNNGPEMITLVLKEKGAYVFEVHPFLEDAAPGEYTIELQKLEPIGKTPEERIDQMMSLYTSETPGASISVMKDDKIVFSKGYGMANLEYDIPSDNTTIFHIASVSKQFTAFAILLLAEDDKLGLDDDIRKYIPEVPDFGNTITLRHLANHTSGLRDQWNLLIMTGWRFDDVFTTEHALKLISRQKELNFRPGEEFLYCNTGFTLLAEVVARVSGKSFVEFTKEHIFDPLKMDRSFFYDDHQMIVKNRAYSYQKAGNGYKNSVLSYSNPGATSLFTTPDDLMKWSLNFENPKIGNKETMREMHTQGVLNNGDSISYAFGQSIGNYKGLANYEHGGADAGFRTYLTRFPNEKLAVAVFGNEASFNPGKIAYEIVELFIGDLLDEDIKEEKSEETDDIVVKKSILKKYTGEYELQPGFIITVRLDNDTLKGQATGQLDFNMIPESDTLFIVEGAAAKISFPESVKKEVSYLTLYQGGNVMKAYRYGSIDKGSIELSDYTGFFYNDELATGYTIALANDTLTVSHSKVSDFVLNPLDKDAFAGTFWAFGSVEFVRNNIEEIIGFRVNNGRVRNLYFEKR